ncbi:DUF1015 domain-containing protein [Rapidithrix thailandica]|uniref:DUF1015 domain-containing protein n=1 Tax=Rapidithrix thailandica TaxID=413964 RepID=A0AAW9S409_9BACT
MPLIQPFKAWRYHEKHAGQIDQLTSPLFDVVSEAQRKKLYANPLNSIHISVPQGVEPDKAARRVLQQWIREGDIVQDRKDAIYVYYQYFYLPNDPKRYCRKGFICMAHLAAGENDILIHENVMPHAVNDRVSLLRETAFNVSPTHGLYSDMAFELEPYMDQAIRTPLYKTEDYQGVQDVLGIIEDPEVIKQFVRKMRGQRLILADGHHRYAGSLAYQKERIKSNPHHTGKEPYNYHLIYLTNTEAKDLRILPTHRLLKGWPEFHPEVFLECLQQYFKVKEVDTPLQLNELISGKPWHFGLLLKDRAFYMSLKPECFEQLSWHFPDQVKAMDLTVLHFFVFEKCLGIKGKYQTQSQNIFFERNYTECALAVVQGNAQAAFITNEISIEQVKDICYSGYTMPQKSTYFYPKVICGFLFADVKD